MVQAKQPEGVPQEYRGREQTFIKHFILRSYLERVAYHVLWQWERFTFVDGYSGPWESKTKSYDDTSFGIAIKLLRKVREDLRALGKDRDVRCVFVEEDAGAFRKLEQATLTASDLKAKAIHGKFEESIEEVQKLVGSSFALISVDPTGWSYDLEKLGPLLRNHKGEVLINFMYQHFNRFVDDKRPEIQASQVLPFGDPQWRDRLRSLTSGGVPKEDAILELLREQLRKIGDFKHVLSTRVRHRTSERAHFYLLYGTRHPKGLIEFRSVEKKAMEAEEWCRIEARQDAQIARTNQMPLFSATEVVRPKTEKELRQAGIDAARGWLLGHLRACGGLSYDKALALVLERYPVTEPELKDLLLALQKSGLAILKGMPPGKRKPTSGVMVTLAPERLEKSRATGGRG